MHNRIMVIVTAMIALSVHAMGVSASNALERYVKKCQHPAGQIVVVAEGDFEPRSRGSYSIRIYSNAQPEYPTDDFLCGIIRSRAGTVEDVLFADVDRDGTEEIIVTIRSVGTGSYLSAEAFEFNGKDIALAATVADLQKAADCVAALMATMRKAPNKPSATR